MMKNLSCLSIFNSIIYRTIILQEHSQSNSQLQQLLFLLFNELQLLKYVLLNYTMSQVSHTSIDQFVQYLIRPHLYFISNQSQLAYSVATFFFVQVVFIYWAYLLTSSKSKQPNENITGITEKKQERTTLTLILLQAWKMIFLLLSNCFGYQLIEGAFIILFDTSNYNIFCSICSIIIIIQISFIICIQDQFINQSLHYLPKQLYQQIKLTPLTILGKVFIIIIVITYSSTFQYKLIVVHTFLVFSSLLTLYTNLILQIRVECVTIYITIYSQSIVLFVALEKLVAIITEQNQFQFLWILLSILSARSLEIYYYQQYSFHLFSVDYNSFNYSDQLLKHQKLKFHYYQNISKKENQEYKIINFILLNLHQSSCFKSQCLCRNENLRMMKISSLILKQNVDELNLLKHQQLQSAYFYICLIQTQIYQQHFFQALNLSQQVINSLNINLYLYKKAIPLIKEQISFKNVIILKLLEQIILSELKANIQRRSIQTDHQHQISKAIRQYQFELDSRKDLSERFDEIIKIKIDLLTSLANQGFGNYSKLNKTVFNAIEIIENFKQLLQNKFLQSPTANNQSQSMFLQVEILNDLINSQTINSMNIYFEDQEKYANANLIYQQISSQCSYIKLQIKDEENIEIEQLVMKNDFKNLKSNYSCFSDIIPTSLREIHKLYIRHFFKNGLNQFYLNFGNSFIKFRDGIIIPIEMCMDFSFDQSHNQLSSTIFIKKQNDSMNVHIILLDAQFKIKEINQTLYCNILNHHDNNKMTLYDLHISQIIPRFNQYEYKANTLLGQCEIFLPLGYSQITKSYPLISFEKYYGVINVKVRTFHLKAVYYIVEISELKSLRRESDITTIHQIEIDCIDEKEIIKIPMDMLSDKELNSNPTVKLECNGTSRINSQRGLLNTRREERTELMDNNDLNANSENSQLNGDCKHRNESPVINRDNVQLEEVGSQLSSVAAVRRSLYFSSFSIVNGLIFSTKFPNTIKRFTVLYIWCALLMLINTILLIGEVQKLQNYQDYISLLSVKYDIYEPIESFLVTRYTILDLNQALAVKTITQTNYNQLITFPKSNLARGYDDLKVKVFEVLEKTEFQAFLENKYFVSFWYESSTKSSFKNITFRSGILILLNYQYEFKLAYTIKPLQIDSSYYYYCQKNYIVFYIIFEQLNSDILDQLYQTLTIQSSNLSLISAPLQIITGVLAILYSYQIISQRKVKNKLLGLLTNQYSDVIQYEILRLNQLSNKTKGNSLLINTYKLNLVDFDNNLQVREKEFKKIMQKQGHRFSQSDPKPGIKIFSLYQVLILLFNFSIYVILLSFTIDSLKEYLLKSQNTAKIYQQLSNTGVDVLIVYAQREVLYRRVQIAFYTKQDVQDLYSQVETSLESIKNFTSEVLRVNQNEYLLDDASYSLFQEVNSVSLCNYLPEEFQNVSTTLCPIVLEGVLIQGLQSTLNLIFNSISQERSINNFTLRSNNQLPVLELQGATFTAKVIKQLVLLLYQNLQVYTNSIKGNFTVIYALFIVLELLMSVIIIIKFNNYEKKQINILRKIVYLLPQSTLIFDEYFQRSIKHQIKLGELV